MDCFSTAAFRLAASYNRARDIWGPFHVLWVDFDGRLHLERPSGPAAQVELTRWSMTVDEAQQVLDKLERSAPAEHAWSEIERRSNVMGSTVRLLGRPGAA